MANPCGNTEFVHTPWIPATSALRYPEICGEEVSTNFELALRLAISHNATTNIIHKIIDASKSGC